MNECEKCTTKTQKVAVDGKIYSFFSFRSVIEKNWSFSEKFCARNQPCDDIDYMSWKCAEWRTSVKRNEEWRKKNNSIELTSLAISLSFSFDTVDDKMCVT